MNCEQADFVALSFEPSEVDDMMIEFFPRGDSTSYDGFCAVKIRVPDNTKIRWSFQIGEILSRCFT